MVPVAERANLLDISREQLVEWLAARGIAAYRAGQILKWVYRRRRGDFAEMSDIAKEVRALLPQHFRIPRLEIRALQTSADGTRKYLFGLEDGESIESVLIPERDHYTLCVSSQVGCAQNCRFCLTAKSKLRRNLSQGEILGQIRDIQQDLPDPERLTNLVFMGMGEPLANYARLMSAVRTMVAPQPDGLGMSARHITVSTVGLVPAIGRLAREGVPVTFALSLHAPDDALRDELIPVNSRWKVDEALDAAHDYFERTGRRVSIEYALIKDMNDHAWRADLLAQKLLARGHGWVHVNPIPLNPTPGSIWTASEPAVRDEFVRRLNAAGIPTTLRDTRGTEIDGACGQLAAVPERPGV